MFLESKYILDYNRKVLTPFGYQRIEQVHKTKILKALKFIHERGEVTVAEFHTFIIDDEEVQANSLKVNDYLDTVDGKSKILAIKQAKNQTLYDITLDQSDFENYWYYTEGVLSHNSGKSITVACYLAWLYNFHKNLNIGIVANRFAQATEFLQNVKDILLRLPIWLVQGTEIWNKRDIKNELGSRILTDVPSQDSFRGFTVNCLIVDECAFIRQTIWEEFADSIFPSQSALAWKKNIIISTAKGLNHFYDIVQKARAEAILPESRTAFVEVDWREVPRYGPDGKVMDPDAFKQSIIKRYGSVYFEQNYGNSFVGSAETLVSPDILGKLTHRTPLYERDNMLRIYEEPKDNHVYVMGVDAAKEGKDYFAVQIVDVTSMPFTQVASANLQVDYLTMPDFLYEWAGFYNTAHIVVENNEGAGQSIADMLVNYYEYPNMYYQDQTYKYPGFRTTKSTRDQIVRMMQVLMNSEKLIIKDKETINEFQKFELVNGKYQASSGHDDLVMSLAIALAPMSNTDNFNDFGKFLEGLRSDEAIDTGTFLSLDDLAFEDF